MRMNENDVEWILNNHNRPKTETEGYVIEDHFDEIIISAKQLLYRPQLRS